MFIPPGYANLSFEATSTVTGQEAMTAIGVQLEAADPGTVLSGAADAWISNFSPIISEVWSSGKVVITIGTSDPSAPIVGELNFDPWGGVTLDCCPPNVSTLIRKQTLAGGRKGRGRMFLPSPAEDGIDDAGLFSTSQHADNQTRATDFLADVGDIEGVSGVFLFHTDPLDDPSEIVGLTAMQMVATQRRRLRG
jgi:hypothetical protein